MSDTAQTDDAEAGAVRASVRALLVEKIRENLTEDGVAAVIAGGLAAVCEVNWHFRGPGVTAATIAKAFNDAAGSILAQLETHAEGRPVGHA